MCKLRWASQGIRVGELPSWRTVASLSQASSTFPGCRPIARCGETLLRASLRSSLLRVRIAQPPEDAKLLRGKNKKK